MICAPAHSKAEAAVYVINRIRDEKESNTVTIMDIVVLVDSNMKISQKRFDSIKWNRRYKSVSDYGFVDFGIIDRGDVYSRIGTNSLVKSRLVRKLG